MASARLAIAAVAALPPAPSETESLRRSMAVRRSPVSAGDSAPSPPLSALMSRTVVDSQSSRSV